jgi:hypothetical protein
MLDRFVDGLGLSRQKLEDAGVYEQADEIDAFDRLLDGLDGQPRRRTRRKP